MEAAGMDHIDPRTLAKIFIYVSPKPKTRLATVVWKWNTALLWALDVGEHKEEVGLYIGGERETHHVWNQCGFIFNWAFSIILNTKRSKENKEPSLPLETTLSLYLFQRPIRIQTPTTYIYSASCSSHRSMHLVILNPWPSNPLLSLYFDTSRPSFFSPLKPYLFLPWPGMVHVHG